MTNEITTEVGSVVNAAVGAVKNLTTSIDQWPTSVTIVAVLIVVTVMLRLSEKCPNRWIPIIVITLGGVMNWFMGSVASVPADQEFPRMLLGFKGMLIGFIACVAYIVLLKRFEKRLPLLSGRSGDTMEIKREDIDKTTKE